MKTMENNITWLIISMGVTFYVSYLVFNFIFLPIPPASPMAATQLTPAQLKQLTHDYVTKINSS